ncbi:MAG: hypothetical protein DCF24_08535 [Cyanobium sp.]|nr:MAG: hypothetical protein DCF24_08535 [Cyanobium sp.]
MPVKPDVRQVRLGVVALNPAARSIEDGVTWVCDIALGLGFGMTEYIPWELTAQHQQMIHLCQLSR